MNTATLTPTPATATVPDRAPAHQAETMRHRISDGAATRADINRDTAHPVADARLITAAFAHRHRLPPGTADDLVQIVDALVTNAICHACWPRAEDRLRLTLVRIGQCVIVEVADPDARRMPVWPTAGDDAALAFLDDPDADPDGLVFTRGRGLLDVAARAETLTAFPENPGKVVRAVVAIPDGAPC